MLLGLILPSARSYAEKSAREKAQLRAAARQTVAAAGLPPEEELAGYRRIDDLFRQARRYNNLSGTAFGFATIALVAALLLAIAQQWLWLLLTVTAMLNAVDAFYRFLKRSVQIDIQIHREFLTPIRRQLLVRMRREADYWYAAVVQFPSVRAMAPVAPENPFIAAEDFAVMYDQLTRSLNRIIDGAEAEGAEVWERLINQEAGLKVPYSEASRLKYTLLPLFPEPE